MNVNGWPLKPAPPMLAKNTPRRPPSTPNGVSIASMSGKRSSALAKNALLADELEVVVAAHLGVAAEVQEVRVAAPALEALEPEREHAVGHQPLVVPHVDVDRLPREPAVADGGDAS